jgi:chromosome segregation ATPase
LQIKCSEQQQQLTELGSSMAQLRIELQQAKTDGAAANAELSQLWEESNKLLASVNASKQQLAGSQAAAAVTEQQLAEAQAAAAAKDKQLAEVHAGVERKVAKAVSLAERGQLQERMRLNLELNSAKGKINLLEGEKYHVSSRFALVTS